MTRRNVSIQRPAPLIGLCVVLLGLAGVPALAQETPADARDAGLPWPWLVFGFGAQALFAARFAVQWVVSERAGASVVPAAFWVLSILGGLCLLVYFVRRGDPVGITGQAFGLLIYSRNLVLRRRSRDAAAAAETPTPLRH